MSKGRVFIIVIVVLIQLILSIMYGFSNVSVPAGGAFAIWCACAAIIYRVSGSSEMI